MYIVGKRFQIVHYYIFEVYYILRSLLIFLIFCLFANSCGWLCSIALSLISERTSISRELVKSSKLIKEIIRLLTEAHSNLILLDTRPEKPEQLNDFRTLKARRCTNLLNLIRSATDRDTQHILRLQEKVRKFD